MKLLEEEEGFLGEDRIITALSTADNTFLFEGTITEYLEWEKTNTVEHWSWT